MRTEKSRTASHDCTQVTPPAYTLAKRLVAKNGLRAKIASLPQALRKGTIVMALHLKRHEIPVSPDREWQRSSGIVDQRVKRLLASCAANTPTDCAARGCAEGAK
jgi:hypothetical protein